MSGFRLLLAWALLSACVWADAPTASDLTAPRTFTDSRGRALVATIVSIDVKNVVLRRESDQKEFTLPLNSLSVEDQVFLAENRANLGQATAPGLPPLPARVVTSTEVAKAKRFAVDVFMREKTGNQQVFRWKKRPKFTTLPEDGAFSDFGRETYEDFCAAAGLTGPAADGPEIVLCTGTAAELQKLANKFAPDVQVRTWSWRYRWDNQKRAYVAYVFVVTDGKDAAEARRLIFRCVSAVLGCPGISDEFRQSAFAKDSKADRLTDIDRQLVRLLYQHIEHGASRDRVLRATEKEWAALVAPATSGENATRK